MDAATSVVIAGAGIYLLVLGIAALRTPSRVESFLAKFANSAFSHYFEMSIRLVVGAALLHKSPSLPVSGIFQAFGWVLLVTTGVLLCVPWRWHQKFAKFAVPFAKRILPAVGVGSIVVGLALLSALIMAPSVKNW